MQEIDRLHDFLKSQFPADAALVGTQNGTGPIEPVDVAIKILTRLQGTKTTTCGYVQGGVVCGKPAEASIYVEKAGRMGEPGDRNTILTCTEHTEIARDEFVAAFYCITVRPVMA